MRTLTAREKEVAVRGQSRVKMSRYIERSRVVAVFLGALGIVLVVVGVALDSAIGTVSASIGSTLITIGVLSVLYDAFLKEVLLEDVFDAMALQQNIRAIDLETVLRKDQVDLPAALEGASKIDSIPLDPIAWSQQDWPRILEQAAASRLPVRVFLPNHDSPHIDVLAHRLDVDISDLAHQIGQLPDRLGRSWDQKGAGQRGSTLDVLLYGGLPAIGVLRTQSHVLLEIPPALAYGSVDRSCLALQLGSHGSSALVSDFVDEQFASDRVPDYSESVKRPLGDLPNSVPKDLKGRNQT